MIVEQKRIRISSWWLDFLRHLMGLGAGEYVIVLRVYGDGKRSVKVATLPETLH